MTAPLSVPTPEARPLRQILSDANLGPFWQDRLIPLIDAYAAALVSAAREQAWDEGNQAAEDYFTDASAVYVSGDFEADIPVPQNPYRAAVPETEGDR